MNNDNGKQYFGIGLDNSELERDAAKSREILHNIGNSAVREGDRIDSAFSKIGKVMVGVFSAQKAAEFARSIVNVRAEIESLEISFETLLGSKAKADALFGEIRQFAVSTPMQLNDLAKGAQMLLSFNVEADKVMGILRAIGDVSMGDAQKFNSLTLAFSQMSSTGKLMGQDLLQMINAGFNPLAVISEKTGKSIATLKDEMSAGKISADMITQAFMDATSEGGKFYNMLEKQSHGINGALSNLQGAWNDMLNDLGSKTQETFTGAVEDLTDIVKNYEKVGQVLLELIAVYGTYKTAVMAVTVAQNIAKEATLGYTLAQQLQYKWALMQEAAQALLNKTMLANPYVAVATAVAALTVGIIHLATSETDAEKAAKRLNEASRDCEKSIASETAQIDFMFGRLKAAKEGTEEWEKAKKAILNQYGEYLKGLNNEIQTLKDVEGAYRAVTEAASQAARARAMESYFKKESDNYADKVGDIRSDVEKLLTKKFGSKKGSEYYWKIVPVLEGKEKMTKEIQDIVGQFKETRILQTSNFGTTTTYEVNTLQSYISEAARAKKVLDDAMSEAVKKFGEAPKTDKGDGKGGKPEPTKNKKYYEDLVKDLTQQYENLTVAERQSQKGVDLYKRIVENQKIVDGYSVSKTSSAATKSQSEAATIARETAERTKRIQDYTDAVIVARRQSELEIEQAEINAMEDGADKEIRQIKLNYDRLIFENEKRKAEMIEKLRDAKQLEWENQNPKAKKEGKTFDRSTVTEADLSEGQLASIKEYARVAEEYRQKANKDSLDKMLSDVLTYEQQRTKIAEEYERKRNSLYEKNEDGSIMTDAQGNKVMRQGVTQGNFDEINRQEQEALKAIDENFAQREDSYQAWCEEIGNLTLRQLEAVLKKAEEELEALRKSGTATDKQVAVAKAKVAKAKSEVSKQNQKNDLNPKKRTLKEWEDLYKTLGECANEFENIGDAVGGTAGEIIKSTGQIMTSTLSMINGIVQLVQTSSSAMVGAATAGVTALQVVEKASVILTVISAAMSIAMAIINLFNNDASKQEEIEELQRRIDQLQWELDNAEAVRIQEKYGDAVKTVRDLYEQTYQTILKIHAVELEQTNVFLRYQHLRKIQEEAYAKSVAKVADYYAQMSYTADKALGEGRFANAREQLENIAEQQLLIQQQIDLENSKKHDDQDKIAEWKQKIQELGADAVALINDIVEEIIGGASTDIANDLADAFFEAFEAGEDAAEAWGNKVNEIVGDVMKRMLVQKVLETRLGEVFDKYRDKWFVNGQFQGLDAVTESMSGFATDLKAVGSEFAAVWDSLPEDVKTLFNVTGDAARQAQEKGIATASQESVDELNGRMTAVQGHTYSISENTKLLLSTASLILQSVLNIEGNTDGLSDRMRNVEADIHDVKQTVNDIALKGIKIK